VPHESSSDPRRLGGEISGPGDPFERGGVVVDTRRALLLEQTVVSTVDDQAQPTAAIMLTGRINRTPERVTLLVLVNGDGLAALATEIIGLTLRESGPLAAEFRAAFEARMAEMPRAE
jgi:hypothetical protein